MNDSSKIIDRAPSVDGSQSALDLFIQWKARWEERNQLRDYIAKWIITSSASEKSISDYRKRVQEVRGRGTGLNEARTKSTWRKTKYSLKHVMAEEIEEALKQTAKADREQRYADAISLIDEALRKKKRIEELDNARLPAGLASPKSKKTLVAKMPKNFADIYFIRAKGTDLEDLFAAMGVIGGRPIEYDTKHGVTVCRLGDKLKFKILGAKIKGESQGMAWREITVTPSSDCAMHLFRKCENGAVTITAESSDWVTQSVRNFGRKLSGREDITPYLWRNRFALQLKSEMGDDKAGMAIAMGHASTNSLARYGYYGGRSAVFPDKIIEVTGAKTRAEITTKAPKKKTEPTDKSVGVRDGHSLCR